MSLSRGEIVQVYRVCVCVCTWATHTSFILVFLKLPVSYKQVLGFIQNNTTQTLKGSIVWGSRGMLSTSGLQQVRDLVLKELQKFIS